MSGARAARHVVAAVALDVAAFVVSVMRPHPVGERVVRTVLVASLRRGVEVGVSAEERLATAAERRVGVKDLSGVVLGEDAVAGEIRKAWIGVSVVVEGALLRELL